jgi:hypothetical protein
MLPRDLFTVQTAFLCTAGLDLGRFHVVSEWVEPLSTATRLRSPTRYRWWLSARRTKWRFSPMPRRSMFDDRAHPSTIAASCASVRLAQPVDVPDVSARGKALGEHSRRCEPGGSRDRETGAALACVTRRGALTVDRPRRRRSAHFAALRCPFARARGAGGLPRPGGPRARPGRTFWGRACRLAFH